MKKVVEKGNNMGKIEKMYAAYKTHFLGDNILETYFSFVANILLEEDIQIIEEGQIIGLLEERYQMGIPMPFIRQVLGIGVQNKSLVMDHGKYSVDKQVLSCFKFADTDFRERWKELIEAFKTYCIENKYASNTEDYESIIIQSIDNSDEFFLEEERPDFNSVMTETEYAWNKFVVNCNECFPEMYTFIASLTLTNIASQALFYSPTVNPDYSGLIVYLDSPMLFSLLGMDTKERTAAYKKLVSDMQKVGCEVCVFDHNYNEVDGIISRAATWALSPEYNLAYANNAARFFHDSGMDQQQISDFCSALETKLNDLGITRRNTDYDVFKDKFQEDEKELFDMVKEKYLEKGTVLPVEKEKSILIDVRSIVMVYRERKGQTSTKIENAKHLMITTNNAIANVSKKYESNRSSSAGHIPACISGDLLGAILWLNSPVEMLGYQKQQLLADCYRYLKPDRMLLEKYIGSLEEARRADDIDEKKYLFLRTHPVVLDSLMNITRGDYARFDSKTYLEVYDDIVCNARKDFDDEVRRHKQTAEELQSANIEIEKMKDEKYQLEDQLHRMQEEKRSREEKEMNKKVNRWGNFLAILLFGIPYIAIVALTEMLKAKMFPSVSWLSFVKYVLLVVVVIVALFVYQKGKMWCIKMVRKHIDKK